MRGSGGWRLKAHVAGAVLVLRSSLMMRVAAGWVCMAILGLGTSSCAPRGKALPVVVTRPVARALPARPSDRELNAFYLNAVSDLQRLNTEMNAANKVRDFEVVSKKALEGLLKARATRQVVEQVRDEALRRDRLAAIDLTIKDLERLVAITSQQ
ncbi:MAG TPA: hypothetical protein DIV39_00840 [Verrucomicrobiales bacterium]|nr:hypothetical protein [Verrucomicrobiales bacterium]